VLQERQQMVVEWVKVDILHLLEHALCLVEDIPGMSQLKFLPPQLF
jgi:hypothetical protein